MADITLWLKELILNYPAIQALVIFLGTGLGGDFVLIFLGFLAAQGILSLPALVIFSFLGTFSMDVALFILARTKLFHFFISHKYANPTASTIVEAVRKLSKGSHLWALIATKFMVGTRVLIVLYSNKTDIELKKFINYDALATLLWVAVLVPIGFLLGLGFTYLADIFQNLYIAIGFILLFFLVAYMAEIWFQKFFIKKEVKE